MAYRDYFEIPGTPMPVAFTLGNFLITSMGVVSKLSNRGQTLRTNGLPVGLLHFLFSKQENPCAE